MDQRPTLFLSYSHDDKENMKWVRQLAYHLRVYGGVDVWLDQWSVSLGGNLADYMRKGLNETKMVLCVCTEEYVDKANQHEGDNSKEKNIISNINDDDRKHVIPLIRRNPNKVLPESLEGVFYQDFTHEDNYTICYWNLLDRIWDDDLRQIPPIGENPFYNEFTSKFGDETHIEKTKYSNPESAGEVTLNYDHNRGRFVIGSGNYTFTTQWGGSRRNSVYAYNYQEDIKLIGHKKGMNDIPSEIKDVENNDFDFTSSVKEPRIGEVVIWLNMQGKLAATKIVAVDKRDQTLKFKYKIYQGRT